MANTLYSSGREKFARGNLDWVNAPIKAILVDTGTYTPNFTTDDNRNKIPLGAIIAGPVGLTDKSANGGACDANDIRFEKVSGVSIEGIVLYHDTGDAMTDTLIAYIDTATGLPITPNGGDIIVNWDDGANKIFRL